MITVYSPVVELDGIALQKVTAENMGVLSFTSVMVTVKVMVAVSVVAEDDCALMTKQEKYI